MAAARSARPRGRPPLTAPLCPVCPPQVDTMIVQAIGLLDDLDKELNTYAMRVREWYGWHFPEMTKIVADNVAYAKAVKLMGTRDNAVNTDFSGILEEDVEQRVKEAAIISMGTEISGEDLVRGARTHTHTHIHTQPHLHCRVMQTLSSLARPDRGKDGQGRRVSVPGASEDCSSLLTAVCVSTRAGQHP